MANPAKVLGFLDLAGVWDPSLAFVMAGAIAVAAVAFALAQRRSRSWLGAPMQLPSARQIDRRLVVGSLLFGVGWGIAGFCPGPALVGLGMGAATIYIAICLNLLLAAYHQQQAPRHDGTDASPQRHVDGFFFLHRQLQRAELHGGGFLGVAEAAVDQGEHAGGNQDHGDEFERVHEGEFPGL